MASAAVTDIDFDPLPHELPENRGRYSIRKAFRQMAERVKGSALEALDGLEREVSDEIAHRSGRRARGVFIPWSAPLESRAFDTTSGVGGVTTRLGTWIDVLRAKSVCAALGATIMADLRGAGFAFPKKTSTSTVTWVGEGNAPSESHPAVDQQVPLTPRTASVYSDLTVRAMASIPNLPELIFEDLTRAIAVEVDRIALNGPGNSDKPLGLLQNPSMAVVSAGTNGGNPTLALVAQLEQTVGNSNADVGSLAFLTTPNGRYKLRTTVKASGSRTLWEDDQPGPLGYVGMATNQLPSTLTKGSSGAVCSPLLFGNWNDLLIGSWSAVDVLLDVYRFSTSGIIRATALQELDTNVRHGESFAAILDLLTN